MMLQPIKLELIEGEQTTEVAILDRAPIDIGREPGADGITVSSSAISRVHGRFIHFGTHWIFMDLGSTNGSWLNGVKLGPEQPKVVRAGDILQLGDVGIQLSAAGLESGKFGPSVMALQGGSPFQEFPVPEYGRAVNVGGNEPDLVIPGDIRDEPALTIEKRGNKVEAFQSSTDLPLFHNGRRIEGAVALAHNDELKISNLVFLYQEGAGSQGRSGTGVATWGDEPEMSSAKVAWLAENPEVGGSGQYSRSVMRSSAFGTAPDESDNEGFGPDSATNVRRVGTTATRTPPTYVFQAIENRIILFIGFLLVLAVLVGLVWWLAK